ERAGYPLEEHEDRTHQRRNHAAGREQSPPPDLSAGLMRVTAQADGADPRVISAAHRFFPLFLIPPSRNGNAITTESPIQPPIKARESCAGFGRGIPCGNGNTWAVR